MRLILDTNLWISYLISSKYIKLDQLILDKKVKLLFSQESLEEFIEVANRPKLRKYFKEESLRELLGYFDLYGEIVEVDSDIKICRDPKDNFLLNLSKDGAADYLITGDKDLLEIDEFESTKIITYREFEDTIE